MVVSVPMPRGVPKVDGVPRGRDGSPWPGGVPTAGRVPGVAGVPHGRERSPWLGGVPKVAPDELCIAADVGGSGFSHIRVTGALQLGVFIAPRAQLQLAGTVTQHPASVSPQSGAARSTMGSGPC